VNGERACELPPRNVSFALLIPNQYAQSFLEKYDDNDNGDDCPIHELFFASQSKSTLQSRIPWQVKQVLIDNETLWKEASDMKLVTSSDVRRRSINDEEDVVSFIKLSRLWKPDPLVVSDILPLLTNWKLDMDIPTATPPHHHSSSYSLVWDLGCGAGRDVCYLAEEMKEIQYNSLLLSRQQQQQQQQQIQQIQQFTSRSIHIVGVDNHKGSEKRCQLLWTNRNVQDITESLTWDLNKLHLVRQLLMNPMNHLQKLQQQKQQQQQRQPDIVCIYAIRYLNRKLFSYIANSHSVVQDSNDDPSKANAVITDNNIYTKSTKHELPPPLVLPIGTIVAISHFCKPTEDARWNFDHPKESNVLERLELERLFTIVDTVNVAVNYDNAQTHRWHILKNDIIMDGDHGRTLLQFVARKVA
jgi:hypothetical protein